MNARTLAVLAVTATAVGVAPTAGAAVLGRTTSGSVGSTTLRGSALMGPGGFTSLDPDVRLGQAASAATPLRLGLQLPMRNLGQAQALVARGVVLTPAQFDARFAPTKAQFDKVTGWATQHGLRVTAVSRGTGQVQVAANAVAVNKAFGVTMRAASLGGVKGLAADRAPRAPSYLGLSGVSGLNSLHRMRTMNENTKQLLSRVGAAASTTDGKADCATYWGQHLLPSVKKYGDQSNYICGYTPTQLTTMYGAKAFQGAKPTIGILLWGNDPLTLSETNGYMSEVGYPPLTDYRPYVDVPSAQMAACDPTGTGSEQNLDVQSSHAIAPNSAIRYYGAASCFDADLTAALQRMVDAHQVSTISMSFGSTSDAGMTAADMAAWNRPLLKAALTGISVFASTGDSGDNSEATDGQPHVGYPASSPYLTAVGGTSVGLTASGAVHTAAWENSYYQQAGPASSSFVNVTSRLGYDGGGGGVSQAFAQPSWQKGKVSGLSSTMRVVPDVSAIANPYTGYTVRYTDWSTGAPTIAESAFGGTSLASPVIGAMVALAKSHNNVRIGNAAPTFYKLAGTGALTDVNSRQAMGASIQGSKNLYVIGFDDKPLSLVSGRGFDNATGLGTPNGARFFPAFK